MSLKNHLPTTLCCIALILSLIACTGDDLPNQAQTDQDQSTLNDDMTLDMSTDASRDADKDRIDSTQDMPDASTQPEDQPADLDTPDLVDVPDMTADKDLSPFLPSSPCVEQARELACEYNTTEVDADGLTRDVHWQVPAGEPPLSGWPIVVFFQGSLYSSELAWDNTEGSLYGAYQLTRTIKELLDRGFAVLAPEASYGGSTYWDTNIWPYNYSWESSNDHDLMLAIFDAAEEGTFGQLNTDRWFAMGISSGGYMTSRMAVAYPGKFTALAIASASYATCGGYYCSVPDAEDLPQDHPPTLFLHGSLDSTVPLYTMEYYFDELQLLNVATEQIVDDTAGHEWIPAAVEAVPRWFTTMN